jgi:hypothetical protein
MVAIERANQPKSAGILKSRIDFNKGDQRPREKRINFINHFSRGKRPSPGRGRRRCAPSRRRRRTRRIKTRRSGAIGARGLSVTIRAVATATGESHRHEDPARPPSTTLYTPALRTRAVPDPDAVVSTKAARTPAQDKIPSSAGAAIGSRAAPPVEGAATPSLPPSNATRHSRRLPVRRSRAPPFAWEEWSADAAPSAS